MEPEVMITISLLTGPIASVLMYTAGFVLAAWLAGHCLQAMIIYVPKVKREASIAFRISYWLMLISLAIATIAWVFLVVTHLAAPNSWWGQQSHWNIPIVTAFYFLPVALAWAVWNWRHIWVRFGVIALALLYFGNCFITLYFGFGAFFLPAALVIVLASAFRVYAAPPSTVGDARLTRGGGV
jgi:hypothetical protein